MKKYLVDLTADERAALQAVIRRGKTSARKVTRARILLHAAKGATGSEIVSALGVGQATVERTRRRFVAEGLGVTIEIGEKYLRDAGRNPDKQMKSVLDSLQLARRPTVRFVFNKWENFEDELKNY